MLIGIIIVLLLLAAWAYLDWQYVKLGLEGPRDTVGNGITIGLAKAFDNRSLALRIERLSNSLAQMKVVDQKAPDNIGKLQGQSSTTSSRTLTLDATDPTKIATTTEKTSATRPAANGSAKNADGGDAKKVEPQAEVTLSAGDILNEQLNLASQIMNLQTLYERSLTDRLIGEDARLQTVLGFQVSITPPAGFENSVAIVEVAVRIKPPQGPLVAAERVSLVAMIPQEKTYNAQTISTESDSIGGSAVASVVTLGVTAKGESRELFVHRDSDTVAFERSSITEPRLFNDDNATVFGWEFRPVLGRQTVSPGMRQMLAVISIPTPDKSEYVADVPIEIITRSYWRRYNHRKQTTAPKWNWFPQTIDGSGAIVNKVQELAIPTTAKIQQGLAPKVAQISWVNSGTDGATVIVKGENLFPGTKVFAAGKVYREEDGTLTLKSDQALEFETTLKAIASGDAVLSGRFGRSSQLEVDEKIPSVTSLYITRAGIKQSRRGKDLRISIDVKGIDDLGADTDLEVAHLENLPEPILFVGNEPVPLPYDYWPLDPHEPDPASTPVTGEKAAKGEFSFAKPSTKKSIRVEAWIPSRIVVTRNSSVVFRVPFCGLDYQASWPLQFFEPSVTRLGGDATNSVFRIAHSLDHKRKLTVELDQTYDNAPALVKVAPEDGDYRFTIANNILEQYRNLVLRIEGAEPYVVAIPEDKPKPKPVIDLNAKPPEIGKGTIGPAEWSGSDLGLITGVTLVTTPLVVAPAPAGTPAPSPTRTPASFTVYDSGNKIAVYFNASSTEVIGKADVEFQFGSTATEVLHAPLLIASPQPAVI